MRLPPAILVLVTACSPPAPEQGTEPVMPPPAPVAETTDAAPLPPGVLAMAEGEHGEIRVDEVDGMRRLLIAGEVMAALPVGKKAGQVGPDPIVTVVERLRPKAKTALVLGLGSGKTAGDLAAAGLEVTAVELEPKVIEYARTYFGYEGDAIAAEGLAYMRSHEKAYDVVLMDAFLGLQAPYELVTREALGLMRARTRADGLTIVRGLGEPRDHLFARMARDLRQPSADEGRGIYVQLFGSGVGAEVQNLYLIASSEPYNVVEIDEAGIPIWPLRLDGDGPAWAEPTTPDTDDQGQGRSVRLVGYVVELEEADALALDLPHWEMGAARYLLRGKAAEELAEKLAPTDAFPTAGDIPSDGDRSSTLYEVLGGGGVKRSDVRFSPLAAMVRGTATLEAVVHPDAAAKVPESIRGDAATHPLLPYGGALYRLEVDEILWTLDRTTWKATRKRAAPILQRAKRHIRAAEIGAAAGELDAYRDAIGDVLKPFMPPLSDLERMVAALEQEGQALSAELSTFELAAACDRAVHTVRRRGPLVSADARAVTAALDRCALTRYQKAAADPKQPHAVSAAKRLLALYDEAAADPALSKKQRAVLATKRAKLDKKYRSPRPSETPPERSDEPPTNPPE